MGNPSGNEDEQSVEPRPVCLNGMKPPWLISCLYGARPEEAETLNRSMGQGRETKPCYIPHIYSTYVVPSDGHCLPLDREWHGRAPFHMRATGCSQLLLFEEEK